MHEFIKKHSDFWKNKSIRLNLILSLFFLIASIVITYFASSYTDTYTGHVVPDLLLDHLPVVKVGFVFFQGAAAVMLFLIGLLFFEPKYIPFTFEATAVFFFVRSVFMVMTHLSAPSIEYYSYITREHHVTDTLFTVSSGNDLFFSGHAGFPLLLALIFWEKPRVRYFFIACSSVGSAAVILGHLHYSIDVFSAYFIAFGIFEFSKKIFKKEHQLLSEQN